MNYSTRFILLIAFLLCLTTGYSQSELVSGYYVVVAAYDDTREDLARKYTDQLNEKGNNAQYGFNSARNLFFVYVNYFTDLKASLVDMKSVRQKGQFIDAWVRVVSGNIVAKSATEEKAAPTPAATTTAVAKTVEPVKQETPKTETVKPVTEPAKPAEEKPVVTEQPKAVEQPVPAPAAQPVDDGIVVTDNEPIKQYKQMTLGNTEVFLSLFYGTKNRVVEGEVSVIDTDRSRFITKVKGNDYLVLPDPKSTSGQLTLTCEVFGYRKIQHQLNFPMPLKDTVKDDIELMGTTLVVEFDLVRYHKGDVQTLYNVYFYNDAAIMLPESKFELTSLLDMMKDSETSKIVLHGHSNGNYHGKILSLGPNKNFFTMDGAIQGMGTAKDLSQQRAETIREYLIANGVGPDRISVKAWGGKKPLFDKHSVNAKKNVRVEVEVVQE
jgi:outer membrane protein OmpA-like peptidoglycan-associated protein